MDVKPNEQSEVPDEGVAPQPQPFPDSSCLTYCKVCGLHSSRKKFAQHLKTQKHKQNKTLAKLKKLKLKEDNQQSGGSESNKTVRKGNEKAANNL